MTRTRRWRGAAVVALLVAGGGCVADKVTGERKFALMPWSVAEEQKIGDEAAPNFEQQFDGPYPDAAAQKYLGEVVKEMAAHSVRKDDFEYQFEILNSSAPNAFALPGGYVYITRGLLENLESEAQFVSVLGHELGHVEHQHSMLQQGKAMLAELLVAVSGVGEDLLQKDPDQPNQVSALVSGIAPLGLLYYSRAQETEADLRGIFFSHKMGYDPREGEKTFAYFARLEQESGESTPEFLRTHPLSENRVKEIDRVIREQHPEVFNQSPDQFRAPAGPGDRFAQIVAALRKTSGAYQKLDQANALAARSPEKPAALAQAQGLIDAARKELPDEPLVALGAGRIQFAQGKGDRGRAQFERSLALAQKSGTGGEPWEARFYLGVISLEANQNAPAKASLKRACELYPAHPLPAYFLGRAEESTGNAAGAAAAYQRVVATTPQESSLYQRSAERLQALHGPGTAPRRR